MKLKKAVKDLSSGKFKYRDLEELWEMNHNQVRGMLGNIRNEGYNVLREKAPDGRLMFYIPELGFERDEFDIDENIYTKFGIISDKHIGSKYCDKKLLERLYDDFGKEGCKFVLDGGDITDGIQMYKGHINEVEVYQFDDEVSLISDIHPDNLKTYIITGNHDDSWYKRVGADIMKSIHKARPDIIPVGRTTARLKGNDGGEIELTHPSGGVAYARSYKAQKQIEQMEDRPDLLVRGHCHIAGFWPYLDTYVIEAGTTQTQTPYLKAKGLYPQLGGWMVELYEDKIKTEWVE